MLVLTVQGPHFEKDRFSVIAQGPQEGRIAGDQIPFPRTGPSSPKLDDDSCCSGIVIFKHFYSDFTCPKSFDAADLWLSSIASSVKKLI